MELLLKDRTDLKTWMDQAARSATHIKRAAHRFAIDEYAHVQMDSLVLLVAKAQALMNSLKPQPIEEEKSAQIVLDLEPTVNGTN